MRERWRRLGWAGLGLVVLLMGLWSFPRPPSEPADRLVPLKVPEERPLRVTVLGTSLSHDETWPALLADRLTTCLSHPTEITVVARPGASVRWGLTQVDKVATSAPDLVLMEFAINDADLRDGLSLPEAQALHGDLITALRAARPEAQLWLMSMSPAQGIRGLIRPRLTAHYLQYRTLAEVHDTGLIDLYPRWRALPRSARGLARDGLHPDRAVAARVIVPVIAERLTQSTSQATSRSPACGAALSPLMPNP